MSELFMETLCSQQSKPATESFSVMELYRLYRLAVQHRVCVRASNALEAARDIKHLMGSLLKTLMHSGGVGLLAQEQLGQTPMLGSLRVSVLTWHKHLALFSRRVNAALALPVRQISLVHTCPRKQHNDLQLDGRIARGKRKEAGTGLEEFQQNRCWRMCTYTTRQI